MTNLFKSISDFFHSDFFLGAISISCRFEFRFLGVQKISFKHRTKNVNKVLSKVLKIVLEKSVTAKVYQFRCSETFFRELFSKTISSVLRRKITVHELRMAHVSFSSQGFV